MKIVTTVDSTNHFIAYLEGSLDGNEEVEVGRGTSEQEATDDLLEQLRVVVEAEPYEIVHASNANSKMLLDALKGHL